MVGVINVNDNGPVNLEDFHTTTRIWLPIVFITGAETSIFPEVTSFPSNVHNSNVWRIIAMVNLQYLSAEMGNLPWMAVVRCDVFLIIATTSDINKAKTNYTLLHHHQLLLWLSYHRQLQLYVFADIRRTFYGWKAMVNFNLYTAILGLDIHHQHKLLVHRQMTNGNGQLDPHGRVLQHQYKLLWACQLQFIAHNNVSWHED